MYDRTQSYLGLKFKSRASCDKKELQELFFRLTAISLRNIGRDGNRTPADLVGQGEFSSTGSSLATSYADAASCMDLFQTFSSL